MWLLVYTLFTYLLNFLLQKIVGHRNYSFSHSKECLAFSSISDGYIKTNINDKDDFGFDIVNFPFLDGDDPRSMSCGVFIFQLLRFARVSSHVDDFTTVQSSIQDQISSDFKVSCLI